MKIEELDLDITSYNQLKRAGVDTVEQLKADGERIKLLAPSAYKKAMTRIELSIGTEHERAHTLHQRIITSGSLAAQNLFDMANALKEMRDDKLYKVLGYSNFEEYCEEMVGMTRRNAYRYISIAENITKENVTPVSHFGIKKLALIASLSDEEQKQIVENIDEKTTYKQLKSEIDKLNYEKQKLESQVADQGQKIDALTEGLSLAQRRANKASAENARLEQENKELRERPVEVAVVDNSDSERRLQETIRSLERENIRQNELMDKRYIEERRELEAQKQAEVKAIRDEYEAKLQAALAEAQTNDKDKQEFKVYLVMAHNALSRLTAIAGTHAEPVYANKVRDLLNKASKMLEV